MNENPKWYTWLGHLTVILGFFIVVVQLKKEIAPEKVFSDGVLVEIRKDAGVLVKDNDKIIDIITYIKTKDGIKVEVKFHPLLIQNKDNSKP